MVRKRKWIRQLKVLYNLECLIKEYRKQNYGINKLVVRC